MKSRGYDIQSLPMHEVGPAEKEQWARLWRSSIDGGNPFLSPSWVAAVAAHLPTTEVALIKHAGHLVAVLPFDRSKSGRGGPAGRILSDGDGILAEPGLDLDARIIVKACGLRSLAYVHKPDRLDVLQPYNERWQSSAHLDLPEGFETYREGRVAAGTETFSVSDRKKRKLTREHGEVRFELRSGASETIKKLFGWKSTQLAASGYPALSAEISWIIPLLEEIKGGAGDEVESVVSSLTVDGRLVAAHWGLRNQGLLVSGVPGYNPEFSRYSPGLVMTTDLVRHAADDGVLGIELGLGMNQLKRSLMTRTATLCSGVVDATTIHRAVRRSKHLIPQPLLRAVEGFATRTGAEPAR